MPTIHRASEDEKLEAYRNAHEAWGGQTPRDTWVERRLESRRHNRADWWVLTVDDGTVAAALGRYPLQFYYRGDIIEGFGIGAVHTHPDHRSEGYATRLCRAIQEHGRDNEAGLGLLFSDIDPEFYRRFGYRVASNRRFNTSRLRDIIDGGKQASLRPVDPLEHLDSLSTWYRLNHLHDALWLFRDEDYWRSTVAENPKDRFFTVHDPNGDERGYVRVGVGSDKLDILEIAVPGIDPGLEAACYRALADLALSRGLQHLYQIFPPPRPLLSFFDDNQRDEQITMLVSVDDAVDIGESWLRQNARIWLSDHF